VTVKGAIFTAEHRANLSVARRRRPPHSAETRAKMSAGIARAWANKKKNGFSARKRSPHSAETKAKIGASNRASRAAMSPEVKAIVGRKISATMKARGTCRGSNNPCFGKTPKHGPRTHWVEHRGVKMRSSWERRFAEAMDRRGIEWEYEPRRFDLGEVTYLPDFYVAEFGAYVEIKGWLDPQSQRRIKLFRDQYPEIPLIVVTGPTLGQY